MTKHAKKILELLLKKPRLTPTMIRKTLGFSISYMAIILAILLEVGFVETVVRGVYVTLDHGKAWLSTQGWVLGIENSYCPLTFVQASTTL